MTMTTPYRDNFDGNELPCPRCDRMLLRRRVGEISIEECSAGCHGLFLGQAAVRKIIEEHEHGHADELLAELPRGQVRVAPRPGERMYMKCPHCKQVMNRRQFATGAGVVVDVCKPHGTFFDVGELPAVIEFVMTGGLEKAKAKDHQREVDQLREERDNAQYQAMMERRSSSFTWGHRSGYTEGAALVDLLSTLFG